MTKTAEQIRNHIQTKWRELNLAATESFKTGYEGHAEIQRFEAETCKEILTWINAEAKS